MSSGALRGVPSRVPYPGALSAEPIPWFMQSFRLPSLSSRLVSLALLMLRWLFGRSGTASGWWRFRAAQPVGRLHLAVRRSSPWTREQLAFDRWVGKGPRDCPRFLTIRLLCMVRGTRGTMRCSRCDDGGFSRGRCATFAAS